MWWSHYSWFQCSSTCFRNFFKTSGNVFETQQWVFKLVWCIFSFSTEKKAIVTHTARVIWGHLASQGLCPERSKLWVGEKKKENILTRMWSSGDHNNHDLATTMKQQLHKTSNKTKETALVIEQHILVSWYQLLIFHLQFRVLCFWFKHDMNNGVRLKLLLMHNNNNMNTKNFSLTFYSESWLHTQVCQHGWQGQCHTRPEWMGFCLHHHNDLCGLKRDPVEGQRQGSEAAGFTQEGCLTVWVCAGSTGPGDSFCGGRQRFARLVPHVVG